MKVILALGNPGARYAGTRHNIGIDVLERLASRWHVTMGDVKERYAGGTGTVSGTPVYLAVPRVYMNVSGEAVRALWNKMGRQASNLIVVHDDMDMPVGRVRIKDNGGDGGHKGIRSIANTMGTREFVRVKVGVGRPAEGTTVTDHVLTRFHPDEKEAVESGVECGADAVEALLAEGVTSAQGRIHSREMPG